LRRRAAFEKMRLSTPPQEKHLNYWKISFGCLAGLVLAVASCGHPSVGSGGSGGSTGSGGSGNCTPGTLGCACNGTSCDTGLSCADVAGSQQCVSTGSGSGGSPASGGSPGTGGAVSSGGSPGTGGAAGSPGTGGGVAGSPGTGGGAAGSPGTGGGAAGTTGSGGSGSGTNLVDNGDFSQGETNWHFENGTANVNNGQYCETNISGSNALFGWQNATTPLMLSGTQMYTLTYKASGSGNAVIHVKVAHAVSPYTPDDYETNPDDNLNGSVQTFTHKFTPGQGDDSNTGIAFFVMAGQNICISAVTLVAN
jgi:hypothetical protein